MSTNCMIYLKLDSADKGSTCETLFGTLQIPEDAEYMGIYCHHDGYPEGVGATLEHYYRKYTEVFDLISNGCTSDVEECPEACNYYSKYEKYEDNKPIFRTEKPLLTKEYMYIFDEGQWSVYSRYFESDKYL